MRLTLDTLVKVTAADRSSMHGGDGDWTKGCWRTVDTPLVACKNGIHIVTVRQVLHWLGPRIGVVEVGGAKHEHQPTIHEDDKSVVCCARVIEWLDTWNERSARHFAADCAEAVLPNWEAEFPDDRPRKAIEAARAYADGRIDSAASWAAYSAASSAASSAARSAAYSAAYSAASWAAYSAASSAASSAARSAASWAASWAQADNLLAYLNGEKP